VAQSSAVGSILQNIEHLDDALAQMHTALVMFYAPADALHKLLDRTRCTLDLLRERVIDLAVAEPTVETRMAALRARLGMALRQLRELARAAHEVSAPIWSGPFRSAADVAAHCERRLSYVDTSFLVEEAAENRDANATRARIEAGLSAAEHTLDAVGRDAALASFIAAAASVSSPRFRRASRMLAALLGVPLAPGVPEPPMLLGPTMPRRSPC
jgi:hypothetical protein